MIQADLDAGLIDYGTSLIYRAWTLFWDARLPARYDGTGSTGKDLSLFSEIEAALPSLSPHQQAELQGWISRPTDPLSPFGPASAATHTRAAAAEDTSVKCTAPNGWFPLDDPDDNSDTGFRAWICAPSRADAEEILGPVLINFAGIKSIFAKPEPAGMGPPVPDTLSEDNGGNGKIDVYLLATNQCRDRSGSCEQIIGDEVAAAVQDGPIGKAQGFPARSSSGYIIVGLDNVNDTPTLAHELFHILQYAHTVGPLEGELDNLASSWYYDASATWAEWHPNLRPLSKIDLFDLFDGFQWSNLSLLDDSADHAYESWIWPLFQELQAGGATSVYQTWASAESAGDAAGIDAAVNSQVSFADNFRDFSVWNLQPGDYDPEVDTGLDNDRWQSRISDFRKTSHVHANYSIGLGAHSVVAGVNVLAAQDDRFEITHPLVRQVTIDLSPLRNAGSADLDIVGQLRQPAAAESHKWRRIRADSSTYTFCRDFPDEDFDLFYVVVSNHAFSRIANGDLDPAAAVVGSYTVKAEDHCDVPIRYEGTFKVKTRSFYGVALTDYDVAGNVTYKYRSTEASCGSFVPPTPDSLQHCYYLDSAQETWTAPQVSVDDCTFFPRPAQFSYANDLGSHGALHITLRSPDPRYSKIYHAFFGSSTKTMVVDTTCGDTFTIRLPFYSIITSGCYDSSPPARFTGWPLSGSCTYQDAGGVTVWSWDLSPIFET